MSNPHPYAKDSAIFSQAVEELRAERADLLNPAVIEERYHEIEKRKDKPVKNGDLEPEREAKLEKQKEQAKAAKKSTKKAKK